MTNNSNVANYDSIVVGAGITGMYQVYWLKKEGFSVLGIEAGGDVGGTWYWNRYPGCKLDTPSFAYGYFGLNGLVPEWNWKSFFASQPELYAYAKYVSEKMDIRDDFRFNTRVDKCAYDAQACLWRVTLDDGSELTCRYLISATGPLSATRLPDYPGIDKFQGMAIHTSRWPNDPEANEFAGKRVGVIGTGATGVQVVPVVAETAEELYVFQRSPNWCTPLGNTPLTVEDMDEIRSRSGTILEYIKSTPTAFPYHNIPKNAVDVSEEERLATFEALYATPGYAVWQANYQDLLLNPESNRYFSEFMAEKIRARIDDPAVAEKLIPKDHPFGSKRVPMETNYYEAFNKPNVYLVDIKEGPIQYFTEKGIQTADGFYELDMVIFATGFDAVTGALDRINISGASGELLRDVWADGPLTNLGLMTRGFPNFFTLVGPHNGASFCNVGLCGALQVEWVIRMLVHLRDKGIRRCEPTAEAQDQWTEECYQIFNHTLLTEGDAWWVKITKKPDGSEVRRALVYAGGAPNYRRRCEETAYNGYEGFELT